MSLANVILIACGRRKRLSESEAQYIYVSPLFRKSRDYAIISGDPWYILSGKYGLLHPDSIVQPYDLSLKRLKKVEQEKWAKNVADSLQGIITQGDSITLFAGVAYRRYLTPSLTKLGHEVKVPLDGVSIGRQVKWLNAHVKKNYSDLNRFYEILSDLERGVCGKRKLGECSGKLDWPQKGVYFFFERGECRRGWPKQLRVVRVGTHAVSSGSGSSLWERLRAHKGFSNGRGNHRSSIFRLHVGEAILNSENNRCSLPSWGKGMFAQREILSAESELEARVSGHISEMLLLWIEVCDSPSPTSDRAYIEKNAISLMSNFENPIDPPSAGWLGNYSAKESIRRSGLWNIQHTREKYDPRFLDVFSRYADVTLGRKSPPKGSIAPRWHALTKGKIKGAQLRLDIFRG